MIRQESGSIPYRGYKCKVVEFEKLGTKVWFYKRFPVKSETTMAGMNVYTELVRFEEKAIPESELTLPANAEVGEMQDIESIMQDVNGHGDIPKNQNKLDFKRKSQSEHHYDFDNIKNLPSHNPEEVEKAMEDAAPQIEKALEALENLKMINEN